MEEYEEGDDDTEEDEPEQPSTSAAPMASTQETQEEDDDKTEDEEEDPQLSEWFKIDKKASKQPEVERPVSDSETEADSDNDDLNRDDDINSEGENGDDWVDVDPSASSPVDATSVCPPSYHSPAVVELISHSWRTPTYLR